MNIKAQIRRQLNNCPSLKALTQGPLTYEKYLQLYGQLQAEVQELGFMILGVTYVERPDEQTARRRHELHVNETEDTIVDNCIFIVSLYTFTSGNVEFTGYFS